MLLALTIFFSAALLFWVQPMFSKLVLPLLGGVPAVWNTCLVFYQATLLAGYLYAHATSKWLGTKKQAALHIAILSLACVSISFNLTPAADQQINPAGWLFRQLLVCIGLPFFALSATAPMLQRWLARSSFPDAKNPYWLYSASNVGSLCALLGYPIVIEPLLRLHTQQVAWTVVYAVFAGLFCACGLLLWKSPLSQREDLPSLLSQRGGRGDLPGIRQRLRWLGLSFVPSSLLLGVTHHITTDIAPIPLLWVIPLALYLLTFALVFARKPILLHETMLRAQTYLALPPLLLYLGNLQIEIWLDFPIHLTAFFVFAMVCHGELAKSRPHPTRLTEFYVWMATGGVLGGLFTALIAPLIFPTVIEYPLMLVLACLLRPAIRTNRPRLRVLLPVLLVALVLLPVGLASGNRLMAIYLGSLSLILLSAFGGAVGFAFLRTPRRIGLGLGSFVLGGALLLASQQDVLIRKRSFFGTLKVVTDAQNGFHLFYHGTTLQGAQAIAPERRTEALTYHHREGPLGQVFELLEPSSPRSIGVFGLGVGTVATYVRPQDTMIFYEIDGNVQQVAQETDWFTYLHDCPGTVRVILGDARISVANAPDQSYDLIIQDAFSSDAIPVHLLTREAFRLYAEKLNDSGLLALNITNRYLHLEPVLAALIEDAGLVGLIRQDTDISQEARQSKKFPSTWVVATRQKQDLFGLWEDSRWRPLQKQAGIRVWTDDYSNILTVLKSPF